MSSLNQTRKSRLREFTCRCGVNVITISRVKEECTPCSKERQRTYQREYMRTKRQKVKERRIDESRLEGESKV